MRELFADPNTNLVAWQAGNEFAALRFATGARVLCRIGDDPVRLRTLPLSRFLYIASAATSSHASTTTPPLRVRVEHNRAKVGSGVVAAVALGAGGSVAAGVGWVRPDRPLRLPACSPRIAPAHADALRAKVTAIEGSSFGKRQ